VRRPQLRKRLTSLIALSLPLVAATACTSADRSLGDEGTGTGATGNDPCDDEGAEATSAEASSTTGDPCLVEVEVGEACMAARWVPDGSCESDPEQLEPGSCREDHSEYGVGAGVFSCVGVSSPSPDDHISGCANGQVAAETWGVSTPSLSGSTCCWLYTTWVDDCSTETTAGRPFIVEGHALKAGFRPGTAWVRPRPTASSPLQAETRAWIASQWLEDARMEHASIPAFARFVIQLTALGAPPELIDAAQVAIGDELAHAKACLRQAQRYGGQEFEPSPMPLQQLAIETDLLCVLREVLIEGCVGETSAAFIAGTASRVCTDVEARTELSKIAHDELRHAELAWAFVAWARTQDEEGVDAILREWLTSPSRIQDSYAAGPDAEHEPEHGRLGNSQRRLLHERALREIVRPTIEELIAA
jgi:hypothetical protein